MSLHFNHLSYSRLKKSHVKRHLFVSSAHKIVNPKLQNSAFWSVTFQKRIVLKMAQINYFARNQFYCTANLNVLRRKTLLGFNYQQSFHFCSADIFSWSCFASCWIGTKSCILQNSFMMMWFYETGLWEIYLYALMTL